MAKTYYTKHHLKFGKNQADNLGYIGFRRRFFPLFYWCLVLDAEWIYYSRGFVYSLIRKKLIKAKRSFCHFEKWQKRINQRFLSSAEIQGNKKPLSVLHTDSGHILMLE